MTETNDTDTSEVEFVPSEYANAHFETDFFYADMVEQPADEFGLTVHRDGPHLAISAGTRSKADEQLHVYCSLTPSEAREIAAVLEQVADESEDRQEELKESRNGPENTESFLRSLLP